MSQNQTYQGQGGDSSKRGGYQQKRGGGYNHGGGGTGKQGTSGDGWQQQQEGRGQGGDRGSGTQHNQQVYVKKGNNTQQYQEQEYYESQGQNTTQDTFQEGTGENLTAEQKFNQLFGGGAFTQNVAQSQPVTKVAVEEVKTWPKNPARKRYTKEQLIQTFKTQAEVNFKSFEKDVLNWVELFSEGSMDPENVKATEIAGENSLMQGHPAGKKPFNQGPRRGGGGPHWRGPPRGHQEEEEDDADPEWVDFDPKKENTAFFGRAIVNEAELRTNIKKEKERGLQAWGGSRKKNEDEDYFEKLVREEKQEALKKAGNDKDLQQKVEVLANDLEQNERNYSDIDLIYEKNAKQKKTKTALNDDELDDLFTSLMTEQKQPEQKSAQKEAPAQQQKPQENVSIPENVLQQIKDLSQQQKQQLQAQKLIQKAKPKFTALQNVQNLFANLPVVTHEKHRIKMDEIAQVEEEKNQGELFKQLMASINPFSSYIVEECCAQQGQQTNYRSFSDKNWTLEDSIFQKPTGQVNQDNLQKTSSEMFVIYKYFSDPLIKVKSKKYTKDEFVSIKDLFPKNNLLQTSPVNVQLSQMMPPNFNPQLAQMQMAQQQQQMMMAGGSAPFIPQQRGQQQAPQNMPLQPIQQQTNLPTQNTTSDSRKSSGDIPQQQDRALQKPPQSYTAQHESLEDDEGDNTQQTTNAPPKHDLNSMESQLKSLLGFNPR